MRPIAPAMGRDGLQYLLEAPGDIQIAATASNGQEAVENALLVCPAVAVIDVSMPLMDGIEATRYICEHCPHTQVVMHSMYDTPKYVQLGLQAGAAGYVLKDAARNELVEAVRTLAKGDSYFSPKIAEIVKHFKRP